MLIKIDIKLKVFLQQKVNMLFLSLTRLYMTQNKKSKTAFIYAQTLHNFHIINSDYVPTVVSYHMNKHAGW